MGEVKAEAGGMDLRSFSCFFAVDSHSDYRSDDKKLKGENGGVTGVDVEKGGERFTR